MVGRSVLKVHRRTPASHQNGFLRNKRMIKNKNTRNFITQKKLTATEFETNEFKNIKIYKTEYRKIDKLA